MVSISPHTIESRAKVETDITVTVVVIITQADWDVVVVVFLLGLSGFELFGSAN